MSKTKEINVRALRIRRKLTHTLIWLLVAVLTALVLGTLLIAVLTSFKTDQETARASFSFFPKHLNFDNYVHVLTSDTWGRYFLNSGIITVSVVILSILASALAGFAFARLTFKGQNVLFLLLLCGMMIPCQVYIIPQYILLRSVPLVGGNNILGQGGTGLLNTYWALIVPFIAAPLGVFLIRQYYANFPRELDEAATLDGCTSFQAFLHIYFPLGKPVFATFAILKFTGTWNDYFYPLIMTTSKKMYTVQIALQKYKGDTVIQWNYLMVATVLSMLPVILLFIFCQKYFVQGIVTTGLK